MGIFYFLKLCWMSSKFYLLGRVLQEILTIILTMVFIVVPKYLLDELFGERDARSIILYTGIILGAPFIINQLTSFLKYITDNLKEKIYIDFEVDFSKKHMSGKYEQLENPEYHNLKTLANNFINGQWNKFGEVLDIAFSILRKGMILAGIVYIMFSLDIFILILFMGLSVINVYVNSKLKKKRMTLISDFSWVIRRRAYFEDISTNVAYAKEVRLNRILEWIINKYQNYMDIFCGRAKDIYKLDVISKNTYSITGFFQQAITYGYLILNIIKNNYSIGQYTMCFNSINTFNQTINEMIDNFLEISKFSTYYEAFSKYNQIQMPKMLRTFSEDSKCMSEIHIEFDHVSFRYPGQEKYALNIMYP